NVSAKMPKAPTAANPTATVTLTNTGGPIKGNADFYALGFEDKNDAKGAFDVRAVGVQSKAAPPADGSNPNRQLLAMAVNTGDRWTTAVQNEFDIYRDVDDDGSADYVIFTYDFGAVTAGSFDGRYGVFVLALASGELRSNGFLAIAPSDGST